MNYNYLEHLTIWMLAWANEWDGRYEEMAAWDAYIDGLNRRLRELYPHVDSHFHNRPRGEVQPPELWDLVIGKAIMQGPDNVPDITAKERLGIANEILWQYWCADRRQKPYAGGGE